MRDSRKIIYDPSTVQSCWSCSRVEGCRIHMQESRIRARLPGKRQGNPREEVSHNVKLLYRQESQMSVGLLLCVGCCSTVTKELANQEGLLGAVKVIQYGKCNLPLLMPTFGLRSSYQEAGRSR